MDSFDIINLLILDDIINEEDASSFEYGDSEEDEDNEEGWV